MIAEEFHDRETFQSIPGFLRSNWKLLLSSFFAVSIVVAAAATVMVALGVFTATYVVSSLLERVANFWNSAPPAPTSHFLRPSLREKLNEQTARQIKLGELLMAIIRGASEQEIEKLEQELEAFPAPLSKEDMQEIGQAAQQAEDILLAAYPQPTSGLNRHNMFATNIVRNHEERMNSQHDENLAVVGDRTCSLMH